MKKFYNIELFRVWFVLTIIYGHMLQHYLMPQFGNMPFFANLYRHTSYAFGYMCEAFFVISGFFMFYSFSKKPSFPRMIVSKIARLWPVVAFVVVCCFLLSLFKIVGFEKYGNILDLFLLNNALTAVPTNVCGDWYITSMFWAYVFYYLFDKIVREEVKIYAFSLLTLLFYSFLLNKIELYAPPQNFCGLLSVPLIRALGGMGLGYVIAYVYEKYHEKIERIKKPFLFTVGEVVFFFLLFKLSIIKYLSYAFPIMLAAFLFLFVDFIFKQGLISKITDKRVLGVLGRYCYSIYMMQWIGFFLANKFLWHHPVYGAEQHPVLNIILGGGGGIFLGILTYHLVEVPGRKFILRMFSKKD